MLSNSCFPEDFVKAQIILAALLPVCSHGKGAYTGILPNPLPYTPAARFTAAPPAAPSVPGSAVAGDSPQARQFLGFLLKQ